MPEQDRTTGASQEMSSAKRELLLRWKKGSSQTASNTIVRANQRASEDHREAPLSSAQQRLWYLDQLVPGSPAYNVSIAIRMLGTLDQSALRRALNEIVRRHEMLRTTFPSEAGHAKQRVDPPFEPALPCEDLTHVPESARPQYLDERLHTEAQCIFSLERGPLFAAHLFRLAPTEHVFQFTIHHIAFDGWSSGVLNGELVTLYAAYAEGKPCPLPELPIQYGDFSIWQQQQQTSASKYKSDLDFWTRELSGLPSLDLPTDRPRPPVQSFRGARVEFELPRALTDAISLACQREDVTPYMYFLGAFAALLSRYAGQDDIGVGSPIANRSRVETEGLIGFFANTIVLRADLSGDPTFRELLGRIRTRSLAAFQHQDLPFEQLVNELAPVRDTSRNPLFQVMLVLQNAPLKVRSIAGLECSGEEIQSKTSKFDLWLQFAHIGETWTATFEYSTDLFDESTILRLSRHLVKVLEAVTADTEKRLSAVDLLDEVERRRVLVEFNDTSRDYGTEHLLHELIEAQVKRSPDRVAVAYEGERLTYATLDERANRLANYLVEAGVQPDTVVGVYAERSVNMVVALLGVLKSGGAYVPLDPSYPDERLETMIRDTAAPVLLTERGLPAALQARLGEALPRLVDLQDWGEIADSPAEPPAVAMSDDHLAYVIYTSGSTGQPKGAMNTHRGICNRLLWMQEAYGLGQDDRILQKTPFSFDVSVWEFFWPLITGAQLVIARPEGHKDPSYLIDRITSERVTTLHFVPSMLQATLDHPQFAECQSLRRVLSSGESLPAEFRDRFFAKLPATELHNLYGPTEAAVDVTSWQCLKDHTSLVVPIGKPIANTQIYILDEQGQPTPIGVPGELHIGGVNVGRGYLNRSELTAERFVPDPFHADGAARGSTPSHAKLYKTGDRARWLPSGNIEFIGRLDSQVKLRGQRLELGEIEHALRSHDQISDAAVLVRADGAAERKQLAAYVVPTHDAREGVLASQEMVAQWEGVFDEAYRDGGTPDDPALNLAGWTSSYDQQAIPSEEMLEWVENTVERILETKPSRVLEIGCGTGLLLLRVAPHVERFVGMDASSQALEYLRPHVAEFDNVSLEQRTADQFAGLPDDSFDAVILNSVAQYFPSPEYLETVIAGCLSVVRDGGTIFLGDIRDLTTLEVFHCSVEVANSEPETELSALRRRVDQRLFQDNELALSPRFFLELERRLPRVARAEVLLKRGHSNNELTRFRYDVRLRVGASQTAAPPALVLDWNEDELSLSKLAELLPQVHGSVHVRRVTNRRLAEDANVLGALKKASPEALLSAALDQVRSSPAPNSEDPEGFFSLEARLPWRVDLLSTGFDESEYFDVLLSPREVPEDEPKASIASSVLALLDERDSARPPRSNHPLLAKLARALIPELRRYLGDKLPEFMIPQAFMVLDHLPVSPNGKLDRDALPPPVRSLQDATDDNGPSTPTEHKLADIWREILGLDYVGIDTNFFELGGDSIDSIQVVSRASSVGLRLTPRDIVRHQSIRQLATAATPLDGPVNTSTRPFPKLPDDAHAEIGSRLGEIEDAFPLSVYQRELLRNRLANPLPGLYVLSMMMRMKSRSGEPLDFDKMEEAWRMIAKRYPGFRTSFQWQGLPEPFQVVHRDSSLTIERYDLTGLASDERSQRLDRWLEDGCNQGFDLESPGHARIACFQVAPDEAYIGWLFDYMLSDGWSLSFVLGDFIEMFDALSRGEPLKLSPAASYRQYVEYQRALDPDATEAFWRRTLSDFVGVTPLVASLGGVPTLPADGGGQVRLDRSIPAEATASLRELAKDAHLTLSNLIWSAWALILARWTGQQRVSFAAMMSGRSAALPDYESLVGLFTNPVPMELPVDRDRPLLDWVREVQAIQAGLYANQHAALADIRRWSELPEDAALFESCLIFVKFPLSESGEEARTRLDLAFVAGQTRTEHPLRIAVRAFGPTLELQFFYQEQQLSHDRVKPLVDATCTLLEQLSDMATKPVRDVLASIQKD